MANAAEDLIKKIVKQEAETAKANIKKRLKAATEKSLKKAPPNKKLVASMKASLKKKLSAAGIKGAAKAKAAAKKVAAVISKAANKK